MTTRPAPRRFRWRRIFLIVFILLSLKIAAISWRTYALVQSAQLLRTALDDPNTITPAYDKFTTALGDAHAEWTWMFTLLRPFPGDLGLIPVAADLTLDLAKDARDIVPILPTLKSYLDAQTPETWTAFIKQAGALRWDNLKTGLQIVNARWKAARTNRTLSGRIQPYADAFDAALRLGGLSSEIMPILARRLSDQQPFTALVLAQNNDELRATGGFITAVARLQIDAAGKVDLVFLNSYAVDNPERVLLHPAAPAAMQLYMKLPLWVFRDANWSPDYPTTARQAAALYALDNDVTPDMIIGVNLNVVRDLTDALAPLKVEGVADPLDGSSVLDQMRRAWNITPETYTDAESKDFLKPFMAALIDAIRQASPTTQAKALAAVAKSLDSRDIMLFSTQDEIQDAIKRCGWDGAQHTPAQNKHDYLMWVESNVGYNKVGPNIRRKVTHHVSLVDPTTPFAQATLQLENINPAVSCAENAGTGSGTYEQRMVVCYWALLRAYLPAGATLLNHNLTPIPAGSMFTRADTSGAASLYPDGASRSVIEGLALIPAAESHAITFTVRLPEQIIQKNEDGTFTYRLLIQRQAGVAPYPFALIIDLPSGAQVVSSSIPMDRRSETSIVFDIETLPPMQEIAVTFRPAAK
jgi:hypothetical protein